ncbi:MAG TPA: cytochrome c [Polyangia bacterium]|nr:cytochrome c [Polyangia bacterium]
MHGLVVLGGLLAAGCEGILPDIDLERMKDQRKAEPYEASPYFDDERAMRSPPAGVVPYSSREPYSVEQREGRVDGRYTTHIPLPLSRVFVEHGRDEFNVYCAVCHGANGSGVSAVAHNMDLRHPPSLLTQPVLGFPPGRIYQVISEGYGLMPSYAYALSVEDRWAVVAYLRALQLSQAGVRIDALPAPQRETARRALP